MESKKIKKYMQILLGNDSFKIYLSEISHILVGGALKVGESNMLADLQNN